MASTPPPPGGNRPPGPPSGPPPGWQVGPQPGQQPGQPGQQPYGQVPYGQIPYGANPKDYWRYQKEHNKAAWRAQRDAWRAQRDLLRAQNRSNRATSVVGPIILITVGVIALLLVTGHLNADQFWTVVEKYWPMLLIGLGVVALAEWAVDLRRENPPSRQWGGYVWLVILLVLLGTGRAGWHRWWGPLHAEMGDNGDDFFNALGQAEHDSDQPAINSKIPANAQIDIENPRGNISITAGDDAEVGVKAHQIAYANTDADAQKIFNSEQAHVTVSGSAVVVKVDSNSSGRTNLVLTVPRTASINVTTGHGGLTVAGLAGNVDAQIQHGDMETTAIQGHVHAHLSNHGDFSAHDIQGDVTVEGDGGDVTISDVHGKVTLQGDYTGDTHLERVDQAVHFHSSRTDLEFARLPGDMSLNSDSIHATSVVGPVRVILSSSKDIEMSQVYGDTQIEDHDGRVELDMAGSYVVEVKDRKGDVEISLPPGAAQTVDARTHNGDIVSDFPLEISGDDDKTATGTIGKGGPKLTLSTEHADLRIRKEDEAPGPMPAASSAIKTPAEPKAPPAPGAPHLKPSKGETPAPVAQ
jgi:DUF4097 and DUF4098 domain-containing protein YvlB